jgi:hypothetical protein
MAFFLTLFMTTWVRMENARRDRVGQEAGAQGAGVQELTDEQKKLERELADNAPWFRYTK